MPPAKFDILFAGELIGGADPDEVRLQLQQIFKLSDEAAVGLFSGQTVTLRKSVDAATATRYREVFRDAKALVRICPVDARSQAPQKAPPEAEPAQEPAIEQQGGSTESKRDELGLTASDQQSESPGQSGFADRPDIDISRLKLVPGQDWTLEDCEPVPTSIVDPDTSSLRLVTPAPGDGEERES